MNAFGPFAHLGTYHCCQSYRIVLGPFDLSSPTVAQTSFAKNTTCRYTPPILKSHALHWPPSLGARSSGKVTVCYLGSWIPATRIQTSECRANQTQNETKLKFMSSCNPQVSQQKLANVVLIVCHTNAINLYRRSNGPKTNSTAHSKHKILTASNNHRPQRTMHRAVAV